MPTDTRSFTAAGMFPYKMFRDIELVESLNSGFVRPVHLQVIPTNRCNLTCSFCSCKDRDRKQEIDYNSLCHSLFSFAELGAKSMTITGGGEPLMYPKITNLIDYASSVSIKSGLVTNGLLLGSVPGEYLNQLTWCRVSFSDERKIDGFEDIVKAAVDSAQIDWAFSYVVTRNYDRDKLAFIIGLANRLRFTHVRVVSDLIDLEGSEHMEKVRESLAGIDDSLVIYQPRQIYARGKNPCYISLLKPVLGADGYAYPCCGAQYAIEGERLDLIRQMNMGRVEDFPSLVSDQMFFDGSVCDRCYYSEYNEALGAMLSPMKHLEFV